MASPLTFLRPPLAREIALIIALKLLLLFGIKLYWFTPDHADLPSAPAADSHVFGAVRTHVLPPTAAPHQETPE